MNMKRILILLYLIICISAFGQEDMQQKDFVWDSIAKIKHLNNIQDSKAWDMEMFTTDVEDAKNDFYTPLPITYGVYPVPSYSLVGKGSFSGIGSMGATLGLDNFKNIVFNSFFVKSNSVNKKLLKNKKDKVYFAVVVKTDTVDTKNYSHFKSQVISRNHPNYIGQGYFKTKQNQIDYTAFITPDGDSYAIVNIRLFDLNLGNIVLIAPQKDGSLRSMQLATPVLSSEEIWSYIEDQMLQDKIKTFFNLKD